MKSYKEPHEPKAEKHEMKKSKGKAKGKGKTKVGKVDNFAHMAHGAKKKKGTGRKRRRRITD